MRLLLDTHILLWWLADDPALSAQADVLIADPANETFVSSISLWEIAIKAHLGKIVADVDEIRVATLTSGFTPLPFTDSHAVAVACLPDHHRDPFDRALIAQARVEPLHLITHDQMVATYSGDILLV
ncbi:MAG TPA: type II toxin-antitoxin system VapC family toxin [Ktedonobacteraceae bacterium]|nr:type II toxin-antitoxin system VapC family toxin [Ktedonobacteraceae bacterium]